MIYFIILIIVKVFSVLYSGLYLYFSLTSHILYNRKKRDYWTALDSRMGEYTSQEGMIYLRDDDQHRSEFGDPPVVVNYFYHEEVKKSAKRKKN